jgi:PAT family beta-lactamase induction signal transducer AmpG
MILLKKMNNWINIFLKREIFVIFLLGISSAIPLALLLTNLKALLYDSGFDLRAIGFSGIVISTYSIKFLWSPLIDNVKLPFLYKKFGLRRSWMLLMQILLAIFILILGIISNDGSFAIILSCGFAIGLLSATQDIAIDGYRISSIKTEDQAIAASFYIYGYHIGLLMSGAAALAMSSFMSWEKVFYILSSSILIGIFAVFLGKEEVIQSKEQSKKFLLWLKDSVTLPLTDFFKHHKYYIIFPFIISFKLCDIFAGSMLLPFLLDIGFSKIEYSSIIKAYGFFATMTGIFFGGILLKKTNMMIAIWIALILQIASNLGYYIQSLTGYDPTILYFVISVENFSSGIGNVILVAYLSSLCNIAFSATQYAILASLASLGRTLFSSSSGIFAEHYGWSNFFLLSIATAIPSVIFLYLITKNYNGEKNRSKTT